MNMPDNHEQQPSSTGGEIVPFDRVIEDSWRSVFLFQVSGDTARSMPQFAVYPWQVGSFLRHPVPDLTVPGALDYYSNLNEIGELEIKPSVTLMPGIDQDLYSYEDGAQVIHQRLNMVMSVLTRIHQGESRERFNDEDLYDTILTLQKMQKYQNKELRWFFDKIADRVPEDKWVTYVL